jgi:hypothetical protein
MLRFLIFYALLSLLPVYAQEQAPSGVPIDAEATAVNQSGTVALAARLRTTELNGTPDTPVQNVRAVIENRDSLTFTYVSGWLTFYDSEGVRCGEGMFSIPVLGPGERAETDTPGLRLKCRPSRWRLVATNLLSRTVDLAKEKRVDLPVSPLYIRINEEILPLQLDNPLVLKVGGEELRIIVSSQAGGR